MTTGQGLLELGTLAALVALVVKLVDFVRHVANGDNSGTLTLAAAWGIGIVVAMLAAHAAIFENVKPDGTHALGNLDTASLIFVGMALGSAGAAAFADRRKSDPPKLLGGTKHDA